ncbi:MAG: prepilin-type N-terminal cleavage/methylation domain-containing protein [Opitutaceae bacterium]|jgi:prepilin-type N-terminal cleavage/methylation domain-containing protein|nr:prepilin-type N-terminal cleavage/methylation domain-containing protein [Opitutaceae bacterium]
MKTPTSPKGFTLIELLTVITIIGILAAIIIPVVGTVKKKSYQARTISNLRQLQMANIAYANDHKETYVMRQGTSVLAGTLQIWAKNPDFHEYLGVPLNLADPPLPSICLAGWPFSKDFKSIGINAEVYTNNNETKIKIADITVPSRTFCFAEALDWQACFWARGLYTPAADGKWMSGGPVAYRSGGKCLAVAFAGNIISFTETDADRRELWYKVP